MKKQLKAKKTSSAKGQRDWQNYIDSGKSAKARKRITNKEVAGRPSAYPAVSKKLVYKLYLLGLSDEKVADCLDVSRETLLAWKRDYPEFRSTIKQAKEIADAEVAQAVYRRAKGCKIKATKIFYNAQEDKIVTQDYYERYPPDVNAARLWLTNRHPDKFRDKPEQELDDPKSPPVVNVNVYAQDDKVAKLKKDAADQ